MPDPPDYASMPLEDRMRPGRMSEGGFLGPDESLREVLEADADTIRQLGLTHDAIADRLEGILVVANHKKFRRTRDADMEDDEEYRRAWEAPVVVEEYEVETIQYNGWQDCPWAPLSYEEDDAGDIPDHATLDATITDRRTGEGFEFPGMICHLIREHGFYEGRGSPYRVDPEYAARVLGLLDGAEEDRPTAGMGSEADTEPEPAEDADPDVERRMRPGALTSIGYLGEEESLREVLEADAQKVADLGLSHDVIADRMEGILRVAIGKARRRAREVQEETGDEESARGSQEEPVVVMDRYEVQVTEFPEVEPCPWEPDADEDTTYALNPYGNVQAVVTNRDLGEALAYPGLAIHLIRDHGFYMGPDVVSRIHPEQVARVLGLG